MLTTSLARKYSINVNEEYRYAQDIMHLLISFLIECSKKRKKGLVSQVADRWKKIMQQSLERPITS